MNFKCNFAYVYITFMSYTSSNSGIRHVNVVRCDCRVNINFSHNLMMFWCLSTLPHTCKPQLNGERPGVVTETNVSQLHWWGFLHHVNTFVISLLDSYISIKLKQSTVSLNNSLQQIIIFSKVCVKASSLILTLTLRLRIYPPARWANENLAKSRLRN